MAFTAFRTWAAGAVLTAAQLNQQLRDNGLILKTSLSDLGMLVLPDSSEKTIASGAITIGAGTVSLITVDTESSAASDDLATITMTGSTGHILALFANHTARTVVLKDGTGNLDLDGADVTLDSDEKGVILVWTGSKWKALSKPSSAAGVDVQAFTSSGTWTKPSSVGDDSTVFVRVIGGGGGAGGGQGGSAGTGRGGGTGGGGGGLMEFEYRASTLGSTETVTIGDGGAGGAGGSGAAGAAGSAGGVTTFGAKAKASGGGLGAAGNAALNPAGGDAGYGRWPGSGLSGANVHLGDGHSYSGNNFTESTWTPSGGGRAPRIDTDNTYSTAADASGPTAGGAVLAMQLAGGAAGTNGSAGGGVGVTSTDGAGSGGGAGGSNNGGTGFAGGAGGLFGGGGGGGGGGTTTGGAGGAGGKGFCIVYTMP